MILTDDDIWKNDDIMAANSGYGANFETLRELIRAVESALLDKLRGGVELPGPDVRIYRGFATHSTKQLLAYGAAQRLAGQQRETCTWTEQDDKDMPGTYASSCGEMWSFIDGGVKENRVTYCHHCGGKVVPASPQEQA